LARVKEKIRLQEAFVARQEISSALMALRTAAGNNSYPQRLLAKNGNTDAVISVNDIEWIEAADYYVCLHVGGEKHLLRESIRALEVKLNPNKSIRLHRSAIVNIDHVREIHRDGRTEGWVLLSTGERVRLNKLGWQKLTAMHRISQSLFSRYQWKAVVRGVPSAASATTAYPSIIARSNPGTSASLTTRVVSTRPAAVRWARPQHAATAIAR
jgi:LytTr DNA-binding domain